MKQKFDIGIIGGGLSGLTLANSLLSKKIKNFILFEKEIKIKRTVFGRGQDCLILKKHLV